MCIGAVGMAIAQFAISAATTVMSFGAEQAAYKAQQQQYENNRIEANKAATDNYAATQLRMQQEQKAASQELQKTQTEAAQARATAQVAAGEAGVSGLSVDALIGDFYNQEGQYERTLDNNMQMQADALRADMDGTMHQTASRINSVSQGQKPSFAGAAVRILSGGLESYGTYQRYKTAAKQTG
ncbi:hypothetical protein [Brucella pseudogrignonensis]|uniref:virion core protein, T7 gp14 family n=1 Tax=Brucella pseudogrignonensis TaxID=419475 RepID=UPI000CFAA6ED|nr:hypothetical protein [Brucella pseudogrignonensis]MQP38752.1 hypothetical protein [Ochrobactrum sp. MYb237]PQZ43369.1 hypothetical protein CQ059_05410 [Brucella pseudogrignonensis]PRA43116.1 hypothetical protein CQ063_01895 [Brucella pseudogrignonensis]PRA72414.1 hypothetical protein CQ055_03685 [Brucella pseudogrignonensis]